MNSRLIIVAALAVLLLLSCPGPGFGAGARVGIEANLSFWFLSEQVENSTLQPGSNDQAVEEASGFNFKQGRAAFHYWSGDERLEALLNLRLEDRTDILDGWGAYHAAPWLNLVIGQMKIPSTAEVLAPDHLCDFISRTSFGQKVGDYSLARTPYISSLMSTRTYNRDLGVAVKGSVPGPEAPRLGYLVMVSNGVGANNFVGANESRHYLYANRFGDFYYGARIELEPVSGIVLGGHASQNRHQGAILQDTKTVVDLDREVWTADALLRLPWDIKVQGFYGKGNNEDYFTAQEYIFDYEGWGVWVLKGLLANRLELGLRYDSFTYEFNLDQNETTQTNWTYGLNWRPHPGFRLQVNYVDKYTQNEFVEDLGDNIFFVNFQFIFDAWMPIRAEGLDSNEQG